MPCELLDLAQLDFATCVDLFDVAFLNDPATLYLYPRSNPNITRESRLKSCLKSFTAPETRYFEAVNAETR